MIRRVVPLLFALALGWAASAAAHPVALGASVSPDTVDLAGKLSYTVYAEWPTGWTAAPVKPKDRYDDFEVSGCAAPQIAPTPGGTTRLALTCDLIAFGSGRLTLPPIPFRLTSPEGETIEDQTPPVTVDVVAPLVEDQAHATKPQERIHRDWLKIAAYAAGVLLAAAALFGLVWKIVQRLRHREKRMKAAPILPAHVIALARIDGDVLDELIRSRDAKPYYSELTEIVREYLENRFRVPALEQTTAEILDAVREVDLSGQDSFLRDLLRTADRAKFAGLPIAFDRWPDDRKRARDFVEATRERPETPAPTPDAPPEREAS